jgi:hypothetical protein
MEAAKYDIIYGRLLKLGIEINKSKVLAKVLLEVSDTVGLSTDQLLKNIDQNGIRFDNEIYEQLNLARTNSSQIGYIDKTNIPSSIRQQVV